VLFRDVALRKSRYYYSTSLVRLSILFLPAKPTEIRLEVHSKPFSRGFWENSSFKPNTYACQPQIQT
jgi:hypothetical protein